LAIWQPDGSLPVHIATRAAQRGRQNVEMIRMKWTLIVLAFGTSPIKTDLVFNSLDDCLRAEDQMRAEYARAYSVWDAWAQKNQAEAGYPNSKKFMQGRIGLKNRGTCVPAAQDAR
jgi:hypothetical protein